MSRHTIETKTCTTCAGTGIVYRLISREEALTTCRTPIAVRGGNLYARLRCDICDGRGAIIMETT